MTRTLVVGAELPANQVRESLARSGADSRAWIAPAQAATGSPGGLARCLVELERELERDPPEAVVLADASDASLAAAIVAAKLLIAVEPAAAAAGDDLNARVISQLATSPAPRR